MPAAPFTLATSAALLEDQLAPWDEAVDAGSVVIILDTQTSDSLVAAVVVKGVTMKQDARNQWSRIQPCIVDIRRALLPVWATADSLPGAAKLTTQGKTFKVAEAQEQGSQLHLTCFRWPDDEE